MKNLFILLGLFLLQSCGTKILDKDTKDLKPLIESDFYTLYKVEVDSIQYILVSTTNGVAITKHIDNRKNK